MNRWIPDPIKGDISLLSQKRIGAHPHFGDLVFKLKDTGINEVAGYQLAEQVGVPVAKYHGVVLERALPGDGYRLAKGDVVIAIERLEPTGGDNIQSLALKDPSLAMRILAFWVFDRHEWGDIWRQDDRLFVIDLEFTLARYSTGRSNRRARFIDYVDMTKDMFKYALGIAKDVGHEDCFREALRIIAERAVGGGISFDFHPHRWGTTIERFLTQSLQARSTALLRLL